MMGFETKEVSGPIRRFPAGFWTSFNQWWHSEFARQGQRPSSKAIGKWHAENAIKIWGEQAVSYAETQRHANRMKCRRTGLQVLRNACADDDDDEDDDCMDVAPVDTAEKGVLAAAACDRPAVDQPGNADCCRGVSLDQAASCTNYVGINFNAHSDPPGALRRYMNADSDVPAAAAPSAELYKRFAGVKAKAQASWMQPDPTVPVGSYYPGMNQGAETGISGLSWDSAFSLIGQSSDAACSSVSHREPLSSFLPNDSSRAVKRSRADADHAPSGLPDLTHDGNATRQLQPPRVNPFADVAAAAAAAAGLLAVPALPAARDAAALLNSIARGVPPPFQPTDPWAAPAWLRNASLELNSLMEEMGILSADVGMLPQSAVLGRPRVLCSTEPLQLPAPGPKRDLDSLLRRGLQPEATSSVSAAQGRAPEAAISGGMSAKNLWERLLQAQERTVQRDAKSVPHLASSSGAGSSEPARNRQWPRASNGSSAGGLFGLLAIDNMPLEALL